MAAVKDMCGGNFTTFTSKNISISKRWEQNNKSNLLATSHVKSKEVGFELILRWL